MAEILCILYVIVCNQSDTRTPRSQVKLHCRFLFAPKLAGDTVSSTLPPAQVTNKHFKTKSLCNSKHSSQPSHHHPHNPTLSPPDHSLPPFFNRNSHLHPHLQQLYRAPSHQLASPSYCPIRAPNKRADIPTLNSVSLLIDVLPWGNTPPPQPSPLWGNPPCWPYKAPTQQWHSNHTIRVSSDGCVALG